MKRITLGREEALRRITVNLAQVKPGDCVLEIGCATEIYRVLKPQGRLLILDLGLPAHGVSRAILKLFLGFMLKHDLKELQPIMALSGFTEIQVSQAKYRLLGLSLISFVIGSKQLK